MLDVEIIEVFGKIRYNYMFISEYDQSVVIPGIIAGNHVK